MELKNMIEDLLNSKVQENNELAVSLMKNPLLQDLDREEFVKQFIKRYNEGKLNGEESKNLLSLWIEVYEPLIKNHIKTRVKKI